MLDYIGSLGNLLSELKNYRQSVKNELRRCPDGHLMLWKQRGTLYKMHCTYSGKDRLRKRISGNESIIRKLARKEYLEKQLEILNAEIPSLSELIKSVDSRNADLLAPDASAMLALVKLMPKYFSELPSTYFLETYGFHKGSVPAPNPKASDEVPIQYLKHRITGLTHEEWYELPYRRNSYPITGSAVTLARRSGCEI